MKIRYIAKVFFVSIEFLVILISASSIFFLEEQANWASGRLNVNSEIGKYLISIPTLTIVWLLKEGKDLLGSDKKLMNWPEYWKLKIHVYISYAYALLFLLISGVPALFNTEISGGVGLILVVTGVLGCLCAAGSVYFAQINIKEILNQEFQ